MSDVLEEVQSQAEAFRRRCDTSVLTRARLVEIAAYPRGIGCEGAAVETGMGTGEGDDGRWQRQGSDSRGESDKADPDHDDLTAHSQWCVLTRNDAETLTQGSDLEVWCRALLLHVTAACCVMRCCVSMALPYRCGTGPTSTCCGWTWSSGLICSRPAAFRADLPAPPPSNQWPRFPFQNRKSLLRTAALTWSTANAASAGSASMSFQALRKELNLHAFVALTVRAQV